DGAGSWLNTNTEASVTYALSPTSSVSVAPFFGYGHTSGVVNGPQSSSIYQYGGKVLWDKRLSPSQGISVNYYSRVVGDLGNGVVYQSAEAGYGHQLGPSTTVGVSLGLVTAGFVHRQWGLSGAVQLSRKFGRSTAGVN